MNKKIIYLILFTTLIVFIRGATEIKVGTYSINPSFTTTVDYNIIGDYQTLTDEVKNNLLPCLSSDNIADCINLRTTQFELTHPELSLSQGSCKNGINDLFYDFIEQYELCAATADNDCVCDFTLDFTHYQNLDQEYKIKLSKDQSVTLNQLTYNLENIPSYTGDNPSELTEREYIDYFIKYNGDNTFDSAKLGLEINNWFDAEWDYNTMTIYKNNDELIFVKDTNSKPKCAVTKNIFKFCATPTTQLYVANQYSSLPQLFSPQIKFALFMDDLPPRPIKDLNAYDRQKSDKHLILEWGKLNDQDLKYYSIYYSKISLINSKIENHKLSTLIPLDITSNIKDENKFKTMDLTPVECDYNQAESKCTFLYSVIQLDDTPDRIELKDNELYEINGKLILSIHLPTNEQYNVAITAVDAADNEINNEDDNQKLTQSQNYNQGTPTDTLAPNLVNLDPPTIKTKNGNQVIELMWSQPTTNIDGTLLTDSITSYKVYYEKDSFEFSNQISTMDTTIDINVNTLESGAEYHFAVTAVDQDNNEFKEKNIIMTKSITTP